MFIPSIAFASILAAALTAPAPAPVAPAPALTIEPLSAVVLQDEEPDPGSRFDYQYAEAEIVLGDYSGVRFQGSYDFGDNLYITGTLAILSGDEGPADVDITTFSAGATYVMPLAPNLDLLGTAELEYGRAEASAFGFSASDSEVGLRLRGGARYAFDEALEAFGGIVIRTILDNNFAMEGGARYQISDALAVQAKLELGDETFIGIGARYSF